MRVLALAIGATVIFTAHAAAADAKRIERSLKMLAPEERLEQLCDYTAMARIRKETKHRPDRAVAGAMSDPVVINEHTIEASGAAMRSKGKWFELDYHCSADLANLKVLSFRFKVGDEIPETKWASYGLWE